MSGKKNKRIKIKEAQKETTCNAGDSTPRRWHTRDCLA